MKSRTPLEYYIIRVDGYSPRIGFALSIKDGWYVSEKGRFSGSSKARRFSNESEATDHVASRKDHLKYKFVVERVTEL
jgi:hypothetical protein